MEGIRYNRGLNPIPKWSQTLGWVFGAVFLLGAIVEFADGDYAVGIIAVIIAAILIPRVRVFAYERTGVELPSWGRTILLVALFVVLGAVQPDNPIEPSTVDSAASKPERAAGAKAELRPAQSPKEQSSMRSPGDRGVVCDRFELRYELNGTDLLLWIDTDLPDEGELSVSVDRLYHKVNVSDAYSRSYFHKFEPVAHWREPRRISLDAESWKANLRAHQDEMAAFGSDVAFEIASIEDNVEIRAVLHLNQDAPRFGGRGNPNLSGKATSRSGAKNVLVEKEATIHFPLAGLPPASRSTRASYDGLVTGESYRLSHETPLMPVRSVSGKSFEESMDAIGSMLNLSPGTVIEVKAVDRGPTPWYQVEVESDRRMSGWINSGALIQQEIIRLE